MAGAGREIYGAAVVGAGPNGLAAAIVNPLRRRLRAPIDRRFYRRKYDAAKTLAAFSEKLRNETDLDKLGDDLVSVVRETMQPEHASLWLRPGDGTGEAGRGKSGE